MKKALMLWIVAVAFLIASCSKQAPDPAGQGPYFPQVKEIIQQNCLGCHIQGGQGMPVILTDDSAIVQYAASIKAANLLLTQALITPPQKKFYLQK